MISNQHRNRFLETFRENIDSRYTDEWLLDNVNDCNLISQSIKNTGSIKSFGLDSVMLESGDYLLSQR